MHLHPPLPITLLFLVGVSLTTAQTTTSAAATASVTLVDFSALPSCATSCGPLYDAQGSCTPPGSAVSNLKTYEECFCAYGTLQSFYTESTGVCPNACAADSNGAAELSQIQSWFTSYCAAATGTATASATGSTSTGKSGSSSGKSVDNDHSWFHTHWKWVVMLIILFIGITSIWLGAFLVRRHVHRKREREIEMRPPVALGPHQLQSMTGGLGYTDGIVDVGGRKGVSAVSAAALEKGGMRGGGMEEVGGGGNGKVKKEKKKWIVKERT